MGQGEKQGAPSARPCMIITFDNGAEEWGKVLKQIARADREASRKTRARRAHRAPRRSHE